MKLTTTFLLLLSVFCATPVLAFERKFPASMCTTGSDDRGEMDHDAVSRGLRNRSAGTQWRRITFRCPVMVDDTLPLSRIRRFNVDVVDLHGGSNGHISAYACVTFRFASGGWCASGTPVTIGVGGTVPWSEIQVSSLHPAFQAWTRFSIDYPYIEVILPGEYFKKYSAILGYTVSDIP
jgi:hypothetical protein